MHMMGMVLKKTQLGQAEIRTKAQALDMRERRALILMDGTRNLAQVEAIIGASIEGIAKRLIYLGLVADNPAGADSAHASLGHSREFKDSLVGKTPATNFESFDSFLPTHSKAWMAGVYDKPASTSPVDLDISSFAALPASTMAGLVETNVHTDAPPRRAMSSRGILLGKMYLADLVERMMGKDDVLLRSKIQQVGNEEQLLTICEEVMELIGSLTTPDMLESIERRFLECINKK
jgi:hypothetical protein